MIFTYTLIAGLTASLVSTVPTSQINSRAELQPWEITVLRTHSPSGRPGNDLHLYLNAAIQDPNTIPAGQSPTGTAVFPPSSANCFAQWLNSNDVPWDMSLPCSSSSQFSTWTMTMKKPQSGNAGSLATEKFALVFKLVDSVIIIGKNNTKVFEGGHQFEVGVNMNGQCGGSGVCNWSLTNTPYNITQTKKSA